MVSFVAADAVVMHSSSQKCPEYTGLALDLLILAGLMWWNLYPFIVPNRHNIFIKLVHDMQLYFATLNNSGYWHGAMTIHLLSLGEVLIILKVQFLNTHSSKFNPRVYLWWQLSIGIGNGLVPSGSNQLTKLMLTQIDVTIRHHYAAIT